MKIFFIASIHGKADHHDSYQALAQAVKSEGHTFVADHILKHSPQELASWTAEQDQAFHKVIFEGIKKADAIFVDASSYSFSVGYVTAFAVQLGKPVAVFFKGDKEPHIFKTLEKANEKVQVIRYSTLDELKKEVSYVLDFIDSVQDTRFNFFISPEHSHYLDWIAKNRKIPRSVYLRQLIDSDLQREENFSVETSLSST